MMPPGAPPAPPSLPTFTPVPLRARRDGWTPERQRAFLAALASGPGVSRAARAVGMSRESAYRLRERPGADSFAAAWDRIVRAVPPPRSDPDSLWRRAFYGTLRPIRRDGEVVAHLLRPDNQAAMTLLRRFDRAAERRAAAERHAGGAAPERNLCHLSLLPPGPERDALAAIEARIEALPSFASGLARRGDGGDRRAAGHEAEDHAAEMARPRHLRDLSPPADEVGGEGSHRPKPAAASPS